ncbi:hypothetical protein Pgy4_41369, partial [Pseudomonas savastanoi pv. glycinea str. race 4]
DDKAAEPAPAIDASAKASAKPATQSTPWQVLLRHR